MTEDSEAIEHRFSIIDGLLRETETPSDRLYAILAISAQLLEALAKQKESGALDPVQLEHAREFSDRLVQLSAVPTASLVDLLAGLSDVFRKVRDASVQDDNQRSLAQQAIEYVHSIAFSPPSELAHQLKASAAHDLSDFAAFVKEFKAETDRGAALIGAALVDSELEKLLRSHFLGGESTDQLLTGSGPLSTFSSRIRMCYSLGLITKLEYKESDIIRRVRNEFAHKLHGLSFGDMRIADLCGSLRSMPRRGTSARLHFDHSVIALCMVLRYRPAHALAFRAQERKWAWHLARGK
jgi:mannitol operon repressor